MAKQSGTVVRYYYDPASLGDVPANEFEARLYDRFFSEWPGSTVNVVRGHGRSWGETADGVEIDAGTLREIANGVFNTACEEL